MIKIIGLILLLSSSIFCQVVISPQNIHLGSGKIQQFTSSPSNSCIIWNSSTGGGTFYPNGVYQAPIFTPVTISILIRCLSSNGTTLSFTGLTLDATSDSNPMPVGCESRNIDGTLSWQPCSIQGPPGQQGIQGIPGTPGINGAPGTPGAIGPAGPAGQVQFPFTSTILQQVWTRYKATSNDLITWMVGPLPCCALPFVNVLHVYKNHQVLFDTDDYIASWGNPPTGVTVLPGQSYLYVKLNGIPILNSGNPDVVYFELLNCCQSP
jgi:hypothetical protein